jgi:hypothetical protein
MRSLYCVKIKLIFENLNTLAKTERRDYLDVGYFLYQEDKTADVYHPDQC